MASRIRARSPRRLGPRLVFGLAVVAVLVGCRDPGGGVEPSTLGDGSPDAASSSGSSSVAATATAIAAPEPEQSAGAACTAHPDIGMLVSPRRTEPGAPMRAMATSSTPLAGRLRLLRSDGSVAAETDERRGAGPYFWLLDLEVGDPRTLRLIFTAPSVRSCLQVGVGTEPDRHKRVRWGTVWPVYEAWDRRYEDLFSAWIELLFDAPVDEQPSWPVLHDVLRDRKRNLLYDYLGEGEDDPSRNAPRIDPDCADLPYFLRAYFAFKLGLPFGYSRCSRGGRSGPPTCMRWSSNLTTTKVSGRSPVRRFANFLAVQLANAVHSGAVRAVATDDGSDFYPVALTAESLRPGTIYADPYGHILMVARRVPQPPADESNVAPRGGLLFAVDGQPDGTVARRRFWRGNFLFSSDPVLGSPGFKRFRPVVLDGGSPRPLRNSEIADHPSYGDFSMEQATMSSDQFYDRMEEALSPAPIDPRRALQELVDALDEQVQQRVTSVQNGVDHLAAHPGTIDMPKLESLFETVGPWEDFSTPSRDMRLLIAIDVVRSFPALASKRPERYARPADVKPQAVEADLRAALAEMTSTRRVAYVRSDGSKQALSLSEVLARASAFEMAYNPNDCPEIRWGAPDGSDEASTCRRRAPRGQRVQMEGHRSWFAKRQRPPR